MARQMGQEPPRFGSEMGYPSLRMASELDGEKFLKGLERKRMIETVHFFDREIREKDEAIDILKAKMAALEEKLCKEKYERYLLQHARADAHLATTKPDTPPFALTTPTFDLEAGPS